MHLQRMSGATRRGDSGDARSGGAATGIDEAPVVTMVIVEVGNTIALNVIGLSVGSKVSSVHDNQRSEHRRSAGVKAAPLLLVSACASR